MEAGESKIYRADVPVQIQRLEEPGRTDDAVENLQAGTLLS